MVAIGLYYPYIQFKDETWLKLTALYWDRMVRIVPKNFPLEDSEGVRLLANREKEGDKSFVVDRVPEETELKTVADEFTRLVGQHGDELAKRYSVANRASWPISPVTVATEPNSDPRLAYVYPAKMATDLQTLLIGAGLAEMGPSRPDVGLGLHPRMADVYMLALARTIAENSSYTPVTDETHGFQDRYTGQSGACADEEDYRGSRILEG
uniref:Uncharacterized protein n=1 Tax=Cystobacterineae bacterium TaxID=1934914 RepID=A0A1P8VPY9_9BACT|nr:uncharacterized protein [Cystobacterineae bacterium]